MNPASAYRWIRIVLIASLCLNLLLVGAAAAFSLRWHRHPDQEVYRLALRQVTRQLDHDDARLVRRAFAARREQSMAAYAEYRQSLRAVIAAMQESPRNEDKLQAAIREARAKRTAVSDLTFDTLLSSLQMVSPEGREAWQHGQQP